MPGFTIVIMKSDGASFSALGPAALRAAESYQPEAERLFDDRFTIGLLPPLWQLVIRLMRIPSLRNSLLKMRERQFPGIIGSLLCRARYIDDVLHDAMKGGVEQVVVLGAGFDSRAYRIPGIDRLSVFEVDLQTPQTQKKKRLQRLLGNLPSHVTFVPIDFNRQVLGDVMLTAGFRTDAKTFIICEGVTQYITAEAVDATLRFVSGNTPAGSKIVFTYINSGIIDGTGRSEDDQKVVSHAESIGMPWIFGINPAELARYLAMRGLTLVEDVGNAEYQVRYLNPMGRRLNVSEGERVALAQTL